MSKNLTITLLVVALSAGMAAAVAMARRLAPAPDAASGGGAASVVTSIPDALKGFVVEPARATYDEDKLLRGIKALKPSTLHLTDRRARRIMRAIVAASKRTGVDPYLLIAVARMESDFRHNLQMIHPNCYKRRYTTCQADCGITQHYIRGKKAWVLSYCKRLATNYDLAVMKSATELAQHIKYCSGPSGLRWHQPLTRCVLNRYNSGPFYRTEKRCRSRYRCSRYSNIAPRGEKPEYVVDASYPRCRRSRSKCYGRAAYYQQVLCFLYGARNGVKERRSCRYCRKLADISTRFYTAPPAAEASARPGDGGEGIPRPASPTD